MESIIFLWSPLSTWTKTERRKTLNQLTADVGMVHNWIFCSDDTLIIMVGWAQVANKQCHQQRSKLFANRNFVAIFRLFSYWRLASGAHRAAGDRPTDRTSPLEGGREGSLLSEGDWRALTACLPLCFLSNVRSFCLSLFAILSALSYIDWLARFLCIGWFSLPDLLRCRFKDNVNEEGS